MLRRGLTLAPLVVVLAACRPSPPPIPEGLALPREQAVAGQKLFFDKGCVDCHLLDGVGGRMGPSLADIGAHRSPEEIRAWIKDPQAVRSTSSMPRIPMEQAELELIVAYLAAHR